MESSYGNCTPKEDNDTLRQEIPTSSPEQGGTRYVASLNRQRPTLIIQKDAALEKWKLSMGKLRDEDEADRQRMKREKARWAAEVVKNFKDAQALSEAAEASEVDVMADRASLELLIDKQSARLHDAKVEVLVAARQLGWWG